MVYSSKALLSNYFLRSEYESNTFQLISFEKQFHPGLLMLMCALHFLPFYSIIDNSHRTFDIIQFHWISYFPIINILGTEFDSSPHIPFEMAFDWERNTREMHVDGDAINNSSSISRSLPSHSCSRASGRRAAEVPFAAIRFAAVTEDMNIRKWISISSKGIPSKGMNESIQHWNGERKSNDEAIVTCYIYVCCILHRSAFLSSTAIALSIRRGNHKSIRSLPRQPKDQ